MTFQPLTPEEPLPTSNGSILVNLGFLLLFIIVACFVLVQCSHLVIYAYRAAKKRRLRGKIGFLSTKLIKIISERRFSLEAR